MTGESAERLSTDRHGAVVAAPMLAMAPAALASVTRALDSSTGPEATRAAIADAVHAVHLGAAGAAALAFVVLLTPAPRRFPVLKEQ